MPGIRLKLLVAFGGLFLILLVLSLFAGAVFDHAAAAIRRTTIDDVDSIIAARDMHDAIDAIDEAVQQSAHAGTPLDPNAIEPAIKTFNAALALQFQRATLPGEAGATLDLQHYWARIRDSISVIENAPLPTERERAAEEQLRPLIRQTRKLLTTLAVTNTESVKGNHGMVQTNVASARRTLHVITLAGLLLAGAFAVLMGRSIVRPLSQMTASAVAVSKGDLEQSISVRSHDEIRKLADAFNVMRIELKRFRAMDADKLSRACQTTQTAIDSLPDAVVLLNENGKVELANKTAERLFGIAAGQASLLDRAPWLADAVARPTQTFDSYRSTVEIDDNGNRRQFLPRAVSIRDVGGRVIGTTLILADVTEFHRLDQLKDSLLSMASHELKTPLQCLCMVIPLLMHDSTGPISEDQRELLTSAQNASDRMRRIVEKILDLGRLKSGRIPLATAPLRPADLVQQTLELQRSAYGAKGVELVADVAGELPEVLCDAMQIDHVLTNLLANALRHTPAGGRVTVSAEAQGESVNFKFADTVCGIEAVHLPRLFGTFFRVPGQSSDSGTGLGLALVKQIVESHEGSVCVESVLRQGTTFSFTLPIARDAIASPRTRQYAPRPAAISLELNHEVQRLQASPDR